MAAIYTLRKISFTISYWGFFILTVGMFVSRALMSIGMMLILAGALLAGDCLNYLRKIWRSKMLLSLAFVFVIVAFSFFFSENKKEFFERLVLKLPFLIFPYAIVVLMDIKCSRWFAYLLLFFSLCVSLVCVCSLINYAKNYEQINQMYKMAHVIPLPFDINHIRFSLMITFSVFACAHMYIDGKYFNKFGLYSILCIGLFNLAFLHILSVRSGLLAFYCGVLVWMVTYIIRSRNVKYVLIGLLLITSIPVVMYFTLPTLKNKIAYMQEDVKRYFDGKDVAYYSDGNRLLSIRLGLELGNDNFLFGTGMGDIRDEMTKGYKNIRQDFPEDKILIPHNQFVYFYAGLGIIGLLAVIWLSLAPFVFVENYNKILFIMSAVIAITSFMVEATIENQLGIALYLYMYACSLLITSE
ncbi:MAG: O-antigen ligase family protein [Cytophagaceae bacterium]|nr:O-antigen ligase family protein [Cytophagaceae bacterium]MDW8455324.1 O-antigen ligase family protein [Cytophagaceae bacterium]